MNLIIFFNPMNVLYANKYVRMLRKLSSEIQLKAIQKEMVFKKDPFSRSLRTHKLNGEFFGRYAFSVDYDHRIVFRFIKNGAALFLLIGDHSIYDQV